MTIDEWVQIVLASPECMQKVESVTQFEMANLCIRIARGDPAVHLATTILRNDGMTTEALRLLVWSNSLTCFAKMMQLRIKAADTEGQVADSLAEALARWKPDKSSKQ